MRTNIRCGTWVKVFLKFTWRVECTRRDRDESRVKEGRESGLKGERPCMQGREPAC